MAERGGFEPPVRFNPYNGLANRCFQPLSHLSKTSVNIGEYAFLHTANSRKALTTCNTYAALTPMKVTVEPRLKQGESCFALST